MRCILSLFLSASMLFTSLSFTAETPAQTSTEELNISAPSVVLMESSNGQNI